MSEFRNSVNDAAASAADIAEEVKETGREAYRQAADQARDLGSKARDYTSRSIAYAEDAGASLTEFARRQPWVALTGAFLIGYLTARMLRRLSM